MPQRIQESGWASKMSLWVLLTVFISLFNRVQAQIPNLLVKATSATSADNSIVFGTAIDASGNTYIAGQFTGTVAFGSTTLVSAGSNDIFLAKYDNTGTFQWAKRAGGTDNDQAQGVAVSGNDVYITGGFLGTANFNTPSNPGNNEITSAGDRDIFLAKYDNTGALQWLKRAGAGGGDADAAFGIAVSGSDVYITGYFNGTANFNTPSATGTNEITMANSGDIFLAKYDNTGDFQWAKRAGGTSLDQANGVAVSGSDVYITGYFQGTANFNNPSNTGSNEITSVGDGDIFLAKYDNTGDFKWAKRAGGTDRDAAQGVAISGSEVYITGLITGTADFNNPTATGSNEITSAGSADIFLAKYDNTGTFQWAKRAGGTTEDFAAGLTVSGSDVYITGGFTGTADFNTPSATGSNEITEAGGTDIFLTKYDNTGTLQWAKRAGGTGYDQATRVAVSGSDVYIVGVFTGTANFNTPSATGSNELTTVSSSVEAFLVRYGPCIDPTAYTVTGGGAYCAGGTGVAVGLDNSETGVTYQLKNSTGNVGAAVSGTGAAISFGNQTAVETYTVEATRTTGGCTTTMTGSVAVSVTTVSTPVISGTPSFCQGGSTTLSIPTQSGATYCWTSTTATPTWAVVGSAGFSAGAVSYTILAFSGSTPYVAYTDAGNGNKATVKKFNGTAWETVGSAGFSAGTASNISLAFDGSTPYVAYRDGANSNKATVMKFNGTTWETVGSAGFSAGAVSYTSLAFDGSTPYVAYSDGGNSNKATVMKFNGTAWETVGSAGFSAGQVLYTSLAFSGGTPYVAYLDVGNGNKATVMKYNGTAWETVGNAGFSAGTAQFTSLAFSGSTPYVAYQDRGNGSKATVMKYNGTVWETVGSAGFSAGQAQYTSLAFSGSTPYVAYQDGGNGFKATVMKYNGTAWETVGSAGFSAGTASDISLAFDGSTPYMAYQDDANGFKATVMKLESCISNTNTLSVNAAGTYTVAVTLGGCTASASQAVTVNALPTAYNVTGGGAYCAGGTGVAVGLANSQTGVNYQLKNGSTNVGSPVAGTGSAISFGNQTTAGTYTVVATATTGNCTANMSGNVTVSINPNPTAFNVTGGGAYCAGGTGAAVGLASSQTGVNYQLKNGSTNVGSPVAGTGNAIAFGNQTTAGTYTVVASNENCTANMNSSATVSITALPTAYSVTGGGSFCAGGTGVSIGLSNSETGVSYQLKKGSSSVGSPVAGTGNAITFGLQTAAGTYIVDAIKNLPSPTRVGAAAAPSPSGGTCTVTMTGNAIVTVNALPTTYNVTGGGAYCAGGTGVTVGLANSQTGVNYQLKNGSTNVGSPVAGTGSAISFGNQTTAGTYTVVATATTGNCTANMSGNVTVSINPNPTAFSVTGGGSYCAGGTGVSIGLSNSETGVNYQLKNGSTNVGSPVAGTGSAITFGLQTGAGTYTVEAIITTTGCTTPMTGNATVEIYTLPTARISGNATVCKDNSSPIITFTASTGKAPFIFTYKINGGANQTLSSNASSASVIQSTSTAGIYTYTLVSIEDANGCSQTQSGSASITVLTKPTISLTVQRTTLLEGDNQTLCALEANANNSSLGFNLTTACLAGNPVWRVQVGGTWSEWSTNSPTTQLSNNQAHRYQAACDANCTNTYTDLITLTLNYRASTPQNVSLVADGVTVAAGEEKTICDQSGNALTFNATCGAGERLLYSVDGGVYLPEVPTQIVDGQFHNYRVRCQKSDGTASCTETASDVMRLKISAIAAAPLASLNVTSGCGTSSNFSGTANCGSLTAVWYNATTNAALPNLPTTTPNETTSYYARCQNEAGCQSEKSNVVTFTLTPVNEAPVVSVSSDLVCTGNEVTVSTTCPTGASALWNTGVSESSFKVAFSNVTKQTYSVRCVFANGCQSPVSAPKSVTWKGFELTIINIGQSKSAIKTNDRAAWASQFVTPDGGPSLDRSTESNPTLYYSENANKTGPRYWTIHADACALGTGGSLTFDMLATPESGPVRSFNTHENNAPYFMYANRDGYTELYAQNHPAYGFFQDNGSGGNVYDEGLPKGLYKLGVRYWDQKGWGSIFPSTRKPQGNVLAYQEYWFRIQSKDGIGVGAARVASDNILSSRRDLNPLTFAEVMPNPVSNTLRLKVLDAKNQKVNVSLMDASGRALLQRAFVPETNQHQEEFNVSEMANGMYFLKVSNAEKQTTLKVVKVQ